MIAFLLLLSVDASRRSEADWIPLRVGNTWTYSAPDGEYTRTVVGYRTIRGLEAAKIVVRYPDDRTWVEYVVRDRKGYSSVAYESGGKFRESDPFVFFRLPVRGGQKWESQGVSFKDCGTETIEVMGRRIACRKIHSLVMTGGRGATVTYESWYAPGIGLVRERTRTEGNGVVKVSEVVLKEHRKR